MLARLEQRLAKAYPDFTELPADAQKAIFLNAVANAPLSEVYDLEMTHPACIARREAIEQEKRNENINRARLAGAQVNDSAERAMKEATKQLQKSLK